jgi:hypothetical protein
VPIHKKQAQSLLIVSFCSDIGSGSTGFKQLVGVLLDTTAAANGKRIPP